jgi:hypothetical protein
MLVSGSVQALPAATSQVRFTTAERDALRNGEVVARPMHFDTDSGSYRGGLSYCVVQAPAAAVLAALSNVETLPLALPHTESARLIDVTHGLARVELVHGGGTTYTVRIERSAGKRAADTLSLQFRRNLGVGEHDCVSVALVCGKRGVAVDH